MSGNIHGVPQHTIASSEVSANEWRATDPSSGRDHGRNIYEESQYGSMARQTSEDLSTLSPVLPRPRAASAADSRSDPIVAEEKEQIAISPQKANWEHFEPGLRWVAERAGTDEFSASAKGLMLSFSQRLKFGGLQHREKPPELESQTAWLYTKAYFEDSFEALFGVVYRPEFEARLGEHFKGSCEDDPSWYALRNVVYATGCRTYLAKQKSCSWTEAQHRSWPYFENALASQFDLLYTPTGLAAVRAIAAMNLHIEGAGNPALEYTLCANAVRLAQAKGLHRQPASIWGLSQDEILHRNWLWWAIYVHEKQVVHRSVRPTAIDEDNISCQIPTSIAPGSTIDIQFLTLMVQHSQISARICRQLLSVSAFQESPAVMMERMVELSRQLEDWKSSIPPPLQPGVAPDASGFRSTRDVNCALSIHFAYYGSMTAIHTIFFFPWISVTCGIDPRDARHGSQIVESTKVVADAARQIIRATRAIDIDATSPQWLVFYFPMVGLINLFLYILKYPSLTTALGDVSMLDIAVGHFGHLEVITASDLSYPFARELARIAYQTVKRCSGAPSGRTRPATPAIVAGLQQLAANTNNIDFSDQIDNFGIPELDLDMFDIFGSGNLTGEGDMIYFPS
ncbi:hypothetical protein H2200_002523 [Cladophialophora chaetospira]|uniref:Xylanolytic transcriptional activator regulatory domain-containing protein n=1 Tax=Cladophialophora chaetospira TaxID=386627 RepID=A0AA38XJ17_9EURO|nr:hypothetical protein H2200_002523 [Cladophialophora chaetospira]